MLVFPVGLPRDVGIYVPMPFFINRENVAFPFPRLERQRQNILRFLTVRSDTEPRASVEAVEWSDPDIPVDAFMFGHIFKILCINKFLRSIATGKRHRKNT